MDNIRCQLVDCLLYRLDVAAIREWSSVYAGFTGQFRLEATREEILALVKVVTNCW